MRILIAEDEVGIAKALKLVLEKNRFAVDMVHNGLDALEYMLSVSYDAVVLDIMMPGLDGLEVLKRAREKGVGTPVLFLTAKAEVEDRIAGLDAGADDYLPKPFAMGEFISRVRALTRRSGNYAPDVICVGGTSLDLSSYTLSSGGGSVRLNNKEFHGAFHAKSRPRFFDGCSHAEGLGSRHGVGNGRRVDIHRLFAQEAQAA